MPQVVVERGRSHAVVGRHRSGRPLSGAALRPAAKPAGCRGVRARHAADATGDARTDRRRELRLRTGARRDGRLSLGAGIGAGLQRDVRVARRGARHAGGRALLFHRSAAPDPDRRSGRCVVGAAAAARDDPDHHARLTCLACLAPAHRRRLGECDVRTGRSRLCGRGPAQRLGGPLGSGLAAGARRPAIKSAGGAASGGRRGGRLARR